MTASTNVSTTPESAPNVGAPKPRIQLCTHVMTTGATCGCPAVKGTKLCFHHSAVKTALGSITPLDQVPYGIFSPIPFVFAEDAAALHINFQMLLQAVAEKRVDQRTGTLLHRILRSMAVNLKNPLIAEAPAVHGEADETNPQPETEESTESPSTAGFPSLEKTSEKDSTEPVCGPPEPGAPCLEETSRKNVEEQENRSKPDEEIIAAMPPQTQRSINQILAQKGYLDDAEREYFSLPPYDKEENRPKPWRLNPLHPRVQRVIALSSDRG